jgi:hypothetical protein
VPVQRQALIGADGGPERVVITGAGMAAIGVASEGDEDPAAARSLSE